MLQFQIAEVYDLATLLPLLASDPTVAVPPVFGTGRVGRQLLLTLQWSPSGALAGTAVERIYGLTSTPVELVGTATLLQQPGATLAGFALRLPPDMPPGTTRNPGTVPSGCSATCVGTMAHCIFYNPADGSGWMRRGFPLHSFFMSNDGIGNFHLGSGTGTSAYADETTLCSTDLGADWRADNVPGTLPARCVSAPDIQCARYMGANSLTEVDPLRMQVAHDVARSWTEVFSLIGNDSMVAAYRNSYSLTNPRAEMRSAYAHARKAYDAGLARIFDPRLLEELRGVTSSAASGNSPITLRVNDRIALRRAAGLLSGSMSATAEIINVDAATTAAPSRDTYRSRVTQDALLSWFQVAILADLDARWRPALNDATAEVTQLASLLTTTDRAAALFLPGVNPLGIPDSYVPLRARNAGDMDSATNYERIAALNAAPAMTTATTDEALAMSATRNYDQMADQVLTAVHTTTMQYVGQIAQLCGDDFFQGDMLPADLGVCGAT
ncbi:MAG: hypothetical protein WCJ30_27695, partial [Deltaproteobacteria bacterium]